jgi:hypothetical protein
VPGRGGASEGSPPIQCGMSATGLLPLLAQPASNGTAKIQRERTSLFHPAQSAEYGTRVTHCWRQTRAASFEKLEQTPQSSLSFAVRRTLLVCQSVCALQVSGSYLAACREFPSRTHLAIAHGDRAFPQGLGLVINCSVNKNVAGLTPECCFIATETIERAGW